MAETSSSSSTSSSLDDESLSSLSSISTDSSSSSSESSLSSISTDSSSIDSSSSSSSSIWEEEFSKMLPFIFTAKKPKGITDFTFYGSSVLASMNGSGEILISRNDGEWEKLFNAEDINVSCIYRYNRYIFVGTSPNGKIFRINIPDNENELIDTINKPIRKFFELNGKLYFATEYPFSLYEYNSSTETFSKLYERQKEFKSVAINDIAYFSFKDGNVIGFDGSSFFTVFDSTNISSVSRANRTTFSMINFDLDSYQEASQLILSPYNHEIGIRSSTTWLGNVIFGGYSFGRVYSYNPTSKNITTIFDTDSAPVRSLLTINPEVILASIGNKVYIGYYGNIKHPSATTIPAPTPTPPAQQASIASKNINVMYPNGGEQIIIGSEVIITWESKRSINDAVKIELYKNDKFFSTINARAQNTGTYSWIPPIETVSGNYKIYVEWLSASTAAEIDKDLSDNEFSLLTQSEKNAIDEEIQNKELEEIAQRARDEANRWYFIPVLDLGDEYVTYMALDNFRERVLFGTSEGRILSSNLMYLNSYGTGQREIYAKVHNNYGVESEIFFTNVLYSLYNRIAQISSEKEVLYSKFEKSATILPLDNCNGVFISPLLEVKQVGMWKTLIWNESIEESSKVTIYVRTANTVESLYNNSWGKGFSSNSEIGTITRDLLEENMSGKYAQIKVVINETLNNTVTFVSSIQLVYTTKNASYFFTTKFSLEANSNLNKGIIVANISQPTNTEIQFGINGGNSSDWNDYKIIETDKLFDIDNLNDIKIGIKMVSYDESLPEVSEFAIMTSGNKTKTLNA